MTTPIDYDELLESVASALEAGDVALARRHLVRVRGETEDDRLGALVVALDFVCSAPEDEAPREAELRTLLERTRGANAEHTTYIGCALSDVGERLGDQEILELAEIWLADLAEDASDAHLVANHAVVLDRLGRDTEAMAAFRRAVELDPKFHGARLRLARIAARIDDRETAAREYRAYLQAHPDDAHEWISLAIVLCDDGRTAEAEKAYWRAAGLEPNNVSLHFNWLITALEAGDLERADYAASKLRAVAPEDWRTGAAEALTLEKTGDPEAAFEGLEALFFEWIEDALAAGEASVDEGPARYLAMQALRIAARNQLEEASDLADDVIATEIFSEPIFDLLREVEHAEADDLRDYSVLLDALYLDLEDPFACFVLYRVFAPSGEAASDIARDFEERCGASEVRTSEIEQLGEVEGKRFAGVWWRSGRTLYSAADYDE